ncbi:MAG: hypothetical protein FJ280_04545 [Planctomycetes bacterium]|nr:hypothetical protein [Planctomycetota bacterium]
MEVFAEDAAHEAFLVPFIKRLAAEGGASVDVRVRSAVGGHGRALSEFDLFQRTLARQFLAAPDMIVILYRCQLQEIRPSTSRDRRESRPFVA